jgi:CheY-like chemotaxis protein
MDDRTGADGGAVRSGTVLIVAAEPGDRERYGAWLEEDGFEVLICSGPNAPSYTCIGGRSGTCVLARSADLVVLDSALPGEDLGEGTSVSELVTLYTSMGKRVLEVATVSREVAQPASWLRWPPSREDLLVAVRARL